MTIAKNSIPIDVPKEIKGTKLEKKYLETAKRLIHEQTVLRLYKDREISTETGAKMLGMSLWEFIPWLGEHQTSFFDYTEEEVAEEMKNVEWERKRFVPERKKR
jgi:hypothetical protein